MNEEEQVGGDIQNDTLQLMTSRYGNHFETTLHSKRTTTHREQVGLLCSSWSGGVIPRMDSGNSQCLPSTTCRLQLESFVAVVGFTTDNRNSADVISTRIAKSISEPGAMSCTILAPRITEL